MIYIHVVCITRYSLCQWKHWNNTIDLDSSAHLRDNVIELIKQSYGYDKVLPMATYTTEGNSNTVLSVCRGLGIDNVVANQIKNTLTDDDIKTQFYGNKEKGIKPNKSLISILEEYPQYDLQRYFLAINGLISGRSQHASGVVIFNDGFIDDGISMMKTKNGNDVTCFNADEVEFLGGLKIDILSTDALTRIMTTMDLLIEDKVIEDQGNLRENYNRYLHPDVIDYDNQKMYDMLYHGDVISVFQFSTDVGKQAIRKVNARKFKELAAANSLMRLTTKSEEQPIDKFVKFRDGINLWNQEMVEFGLDEDEINLLKTHLSNTNGICDTQELLMILSMEVAGYSLTEANQFRKLVARANKKALEKEKKVFIKKGQQRKQRREKFLEYVWTYCFEHQFGYLK